MEQLAEDPSANVATMLGLSNQVPPSSEEPKQLSPVSKARPQGPTPMRASGKGSPASTRPGNPTPAHAGSKADERKSNMSQRGGVTDQPIIEESELSSSKLMSHNNYFHLIFECSETLMAITWVEILAKLSALDHKTDH